MQSFPFASVTRGDDAVPLRTRLVVTGRDGTTRDAVIGKVHLDEDGPLRAVVRLDGDVPVDAGRVLTVTAFLHFYAGLSTVRARITLTNPDAAKHAGGFWDLGDPGSVLLKDVSLELSFPADSGTPEIHCAPELGRAAGARARARRAVSGLERR